MGNELCEGCDGHGLVGNILDTAECPFCNGTGYPKAAKPNVDDTHAHVCEACGHIWWHHRDGSLLKEQKREQHKCPACACGPYQFGYNSQREAMEVRRLILAE